MNKRYLPLIAALFLKGCNNITELFFEAPKTLAPVGHCRNYKVEPIVEKSDPVGLTDDLKVQDE
jgi:hypothetical protein